MPRLWRLNSMGVPLCFGVQDIFAFAAEDESSIY